MEKFMKYDFAVEKIELACFVSEGKAAPVHKNRKSHGLAFFLGGDSLISFENKKLRVGKDTVVYFPKGSDYLVKEARDCYAINFQLPEGVSFAPFVFTVKNSGAYLESFRAAQKIWAKKTPGFHAKVKSELFSILYQMQSEYSIPYSRSELIRPAIDYIHANYDKQPISVEELAALCGISTVHLRNTFIKVFAASPVRYINSLKITRAKELLRSGLYSASQAAYLAGFRDESYFSREFKKAVGKSPKEYAKSLQE